MKEKLNIEDKLKTISNKYCNVQYNEDNYSVGGDLDSCKFASRRHEDAKYDSGKLTIGEATQLFKKATGLEIDIIKEILEYAVPNMEWHHAGKLPKSYGGGMKKTYFLNTNEICDVAKNWNDYLEKIAISKATKKIAAEDKKSLETRKLDFLQAHATKVVRSTNHGAFSNNFYMTNREMNGKYGWFDSAYKDYKLTEYFSGWQFETQEKYQEFINIK